MKSQGLKKKVYVGLSGGVDSAVSAALLKKEGYEVTGVFIKAWQPFDSAQGTRKYPCGWKEDRRSAMRAAAVLDIPFLTLDLEKEYKKEVVDYMIREYQEGRTPNPDVMCNKEIKFGHFLKFTLDGGAEYIATGHYARAVTSPQSRGGRDEVRVGLIEGSDKNKDQSYFLWTLTQEQLKHVLFPIGHLQKNEVRELAERFGLPQATRKDSQGLCFLGKIDMKEFLSGYIEPKKGNVISEKGEVIGFHNGVLFFTIGERHGFTITKKTDQEAPLYVVAKDLENNTITVATRSESQNNKNKSQVFILSDVNWSQGLPPHLAKTYTARVRYRGEKIKCNIKIKEGKVSVVLTEFQEGVSLGQSLVLYNDEICIGGGIISQ